MNIFKRLWAYMSETALMIHQIECGTYREPDQNMVCKHCLQHVNDPKINHASNGCTVKVISE